MAHTSKVSVYPLGGCALLEISKLLNSEIYNVKDHQWRRPTIALCSKPVTKFRFNMGQVPSQFSNYFINDCSKSHLRELESPKAGKSILLMDLTRDVLGAVVEIEPDSYIMDPVDMVTLVDGLTHETMSRERLEEILRTQPRRICPRDNADDYFELWKTHIDRMLGIANEHFDQVVIPRLFYTTRHRDETKPRLRDERASWCNAMLERMYAHVAQSNSLHLVDIDRREMVTSGDAPWSGPNIAHYTLETYALFAQKISDTLKDRDANTTYYSHQVARQNGHLLEQAKDELEASKTRLEELETELAGNRQEITRLTRSLSHLDNTVEHQRLTIVQLRKETAQLQEANAKARTRASEMEARHRRDIQALDQQLSHAHHRIQQYERPLRDKVKLSLARLTKPHRELARSLLR